MFDDIRKEAIKAQQERAKIDRINNINNNLKNLESEHDKIDRSIVLGNPLNDPGYQARMIDHYDRKYLEQKESLERERNQILKNM